MLTTSLTNHSVRQWEIVEWLRQHKEALGVVSWVVLDDDGSCLGDERFGDYMLGHVVPTASAVGLTAADAASAIAILQRADGRGVPSAAAGRRKGRGKAKANAQARARAAAGGVAVAPGRAAARTAKKKPGRWRRG